MDKNRFNKMGSLKLLKAVFQHDNPFTEVLKKIFTQPLATITTTTPTTTTTSNRRPLEPRIAMMISTDDYGLLLTITLDYLDRLKEKIDFVVTVENFHIIRSVARSPTNERPTIRLTPVFICPSASVQLDSEMPVPFHERLLQFEVHSNLGRGILPLSELFFIQQRHKLSYDEASITCVQQLEPSCSGFPLDNSGSVIRIITSRFPPVYGPKELAAIAAALFQKDDNPDDECSEPMKTFLAGLVSVNFGHLQSGISITTNYLGSRFVVKVDSYSLLYGSHLGDVHTLITENFDHLAFDGSSLQEQERLEKVDLPSIGSSPTSSIRDNNIFFVNTRRSPGDASLVPFSRRQVRVKLAASVLEGRRRPRSAEQCNDQRKVTLLNGKCLTLPPGVNVLCPPKEPSVLWIVGDREAAALWRKTNG